MIQITSMCLGPMSNIIYIIADTGSKKCMVIDPAWDVKKIVHFLEANGFELSSILLTHGHSDHCNGVNALLDYRLVPVYLSQQESPDLTPSVSTLTPITHGMNISFSDKTVCAFLTPGHTPGGCCFLIDGHLFTGDTLFIDGCGRCDLPHSCVESMYESLLWLKTLPKDTWVYPGHDYAKVSCDTLENQLQTNRFLRCGTKERFIRLRMA